MARDSLAPRLRHLPAVTILGREVRVATARRARLLGLAHLDLDDAGSGLLIPRCSSVHTFGMCFPLDLFFLDRNGAVLDRRWGVPSFRIARCRGAASVLELPSQPLEISSG